MLNFIFFYSIAAGTDLVARRRISFAEANKLETERSAEAARFLEEVSRCSSARSKRTVATSLVQGDWMLYRGKVLAKELEISRTLADFRRKEGNTSNPSSFEDLASRMCKMKDFLKGRVAILCLLDSQLQGVLDKEAVVNERNFFQKIYQPGPDKLKKMKQDVTDEAKKEIRSWNFDDLSGLQLAYPSFPDSLSKLLQGNQEQEEIQEDQDEIDEDNIMLHISRVNELIRAANAFLLSIRDGYTDYEKSKAELECVIGLLNPILKKFGFQDQELTIKIECPDLRKLPSIEIISAEANSGVERQEESSTRQRVGVRAAFDIDSSEQKAR